MRNHWVVQGGSQAIGAATITSDQDIFIIFDGEEPQREIYSGILYRFPRADVEQRNSRAFTDTLKCIASDELSVQKGMPLTDYWALRFATRVMLGRTLVPWPEMESQLRATSDSLRRSLLAFHSTQYLNLYQDVYGLWIDNRHIEATLLLGDLAIRCISVCNFNFGLSDPATKWALLQSRHILDKVTLKSTEELVSLVTSGMIDKGELIRKTLEACNCSIANALTRHSPLDVNTDVPPNSWGSLPTEFCISGHPSFTGAINIIDRSSRYLTLDQLRLIGKSLQI